MKKFVLNKDLVKLINKLEEKKILTKEEADELRKEVS
jgi:uncharacterized protein YutE (UPF0331/DUF86 family)